MTKEYKVTKKGKELLEEVQSQPETRRLEKRGDNEFVLVVENHIYKTHSEKKYQKQELKDIYADLKTHQKNIKARIDDLKKQKEKFNPDAQSQAERMQEENPDMGDFFKKHASLLDFMELQEKANRVAQYLNTHSQIKEVKKDLQNTNNQMAEIELVIPEVLRKK
jgi:hypothetical protein